MAFILEIKPKARKKLDTIPENYRARVIQTLDAIVLNPFFGKKLSGKRDGQYSVRVWPYRIIYMIQEDTKLIKIMEIKRRGHIFYD